MKTTQPHPPKTNRTNPALLAMVALVCIFGGTGCASLAALDRSAQNHVPRSHGIPVEAKPAPMTLPRFLGADVVIRRTVLLCQVVREKAAIAVPALEPKPLALPLSHPASADSPSPAVAGAHKTQKAKAAKAAKVKAIAILAGEDCATNPHVEEGLLAALDDVSSDVRIAAIEAVLRSRRSCEVGCNDCLGGCCSPAIRAKLTTMVFEKSGPNCWLEPSSKARRLARLALDACGGPVDATACNCQSDNVPLEVPPPEIVSQVSGSE